MIASKVIAASLILFTTALSANAIEPGNFRPCFNSPLKAGQDHLMNPEPSKGTGFFQLAGFTISKVRNGVYDFHAGPTKANQSSMKIYVNGYQTQKKYRFGFRDGFTCTAFIDEPSNGQSMGAFVETY